MSTDDPRSPRPGEDSMRGDHVAGPTADRHPGQAGPSSPTRVLSAKKESAERVALRGTPQPVTRLNRTTLAVGAGCLGIAVLVAVLWGLRRPSAPSSSPADHPQNADHISRAEGLDTLPRDYASVPQAKSQQPPHLGAPIGELGRPVLREEQAAGLQPLAERSSFAPNPEEDALRAQRLRAQQEGEAAAKAPVLVQLKEHSQSTDAKPLASQGSQSNSAEAPPTSDISTPRASGAPSAQEHKQSFLSASGSNADSRIYGSASLQTPRSPAQLMAGTIIPAALMTGINSDLPGQIIATVTSPVYDTVTGRLLLIPQGARLLGQYDSQVAYGQQRVLLVWTRLLMPNGSSIVLDRLPGVDSAGQAGLQDRVNWHVDRLAGGAALSTMLGVAAALATPNRTGSQGVVVLATQQSLQDSVNQVGQEITRRNLDIQPTLTIRPGFPLRVIVNKDLILRPYES